MWWTFEIKYRFISNGVSSISSGVVSQIHQVTCLSGNNLKTRTKVLLGDGGSLGATTSVLSAAEAQHRSYLCPSYLSAAGDNDGTLSVLWRGAF